MVSTIIPIVYGEIRKEKTTHVLAVHTVGYVLGGAMVGFLAGLLGQVLSPLITSVPYAGGLVLMTTAFFYSLYHMRLLPFPLPLPHRKRQVPRYWVTQLSFRLASLLYGLVLGAGVLTPITVGTFYVVLLWVVLGQELVLGTLCMSLFGLGRGLPVLWLKYRCHDSNAAVASLDLLARWQGSVALLNGMGLACLAADIGTTYMMAM